MNQILNVIGWSGNLSSRFSLVFPQVGHGLLLMVVGNVPLAQAVGIILVMIM
jgi:hypothetical protein